MQIKYKTLDDEPIDLSLKSKSINFKALVDGNEIGTVEGYLNDYGQLISVVKVNPKNQGKGLGFELFNFVFTELNKLSTITSIIGSWHAGGEFAYCEEGKSTNLKIFQDCYAESNDLEYSALQTPTGKWAKRLGFLNVDVSRNSQTEVTVEFTK